MFRLGAWLAPPIKRLLIRITIDADGEAGGGTAASSAVVCCLDHDDHDDDYENDNYEDDDRQSAGRNVSLRHHIARQSLQRPGALDHEYWR